MRIPADTIRPRWGADNRKFITAGGWLTPYAFACGYVQRRGDDESGARIEQERAGDCYRVSGDGRWIRGEGTTYHKRLTEARAAFKAFDHIALSRQIAEGN